ncbi:MAG: hypothetical protein RLZZ293_933 [Pseudomonadota bacterium]|jgi:thiol:disulfide interchange protein DsbA
MKKIIFTLVASLALGTTFAQTNGLQAGVDYTVISGTISKPLPTKPGKVNVTEFYSYACIHCSLLEPLLDQWYATAQNVDFNRIQVVWENNFVGYAKISATSQALNLGARFNQQVFNATMQQRKNLEDPKQLQAFLTANKTIVDPSKFMQTYNSFTISTKPQEYAQYTQAYNITGTPTFIIGNKYITKPATPERLITVIQGLVNKVKQEQKIK